MNTVIKLCCICFSLISLLLSCNLKAEYKVEDVRNYFGLTTLSYSGDYIFSKGGAKAVVYRLKDRTRVGDICCHSEKEYTEEFFLKSEKSEDIALQIKYDFNLKGIATVKGIPGSEGGKYITFQTKSKPKVFVSPSKRYFSVVTNDALMVFNHNLVLKYKAFFTYNELFHAALSDDGKHFMVSFDSTLKVFNESGSSHIINSCDRKVDDYNHISSYFNETNHFFVLFYDGICDIENGFSKFYSKNFDARQPMEVIGGAGKVYLVFRTKFLIYSSDLAEEHFRLDLQKYYQEIYGDDPYVNPVLISDGNAFNFDLNEFFLLGGGSTGLIFKVSF